MVASTTPAAATGTVNGLNSSTQVNIDATSCGGHNINVNFTSSTSITYNGYTLNSKGAAISVWGSGSCTTSFSATSIVLGSSTPTVSGTVNGLNSSTQVNIDATSCGGHNVNVNFSSSTSITYNGYTLNSKGADISVWGSGSCTTSFTATSIVLGTSGSSTPAPDPTATPEFTDTVFTEIVNPDPWPSNFRPYCANASANSSSPCPWNDKLPDSPEQLYPNSATIVSGLFGATNAVLFPGNWTLGGDYNHPVYLASNSDPLVSVTCTTYCSPTSASFHIPSKARAAGYFDQSSSLDCHMAIIEPDGTEWDMYKACSYDGQSSFTVTGLFETSITSAGRSRATAGAALAAGIPRFAEMERGLIPHALFASTACVTGSILYPAYTQGHLCTSGTGPPMGARLQLTLTDSQIDALKLSEPWEYTLLHAMHDYGIYILDTQGGNSPGAGSATLEFRFESQTQYDAYGVAYAADSVPGLSTYLSQIDTAIDWKTSFRIVSACYAEETCTQ